MKVLFRNSDYIEPIKHKDSSTVVVVRRKESEGKLREEDGLLLFSGSENPLVYQRKYQQRFYCTFDFRWYPFDTQECSIELANFDTLKVFFLQKVQKFFYFNFSGFFIYGSWKDGVRGGEGVAAVLGEGVEDGEDGGQRGEGRAQG